MAYASTDILEQGQGADALVGTGVDGFRCPGSSGVRATKEEKKAAVLPPVGRLRRPRTA